MTKAQRKAYIRKWKEDHPEKVREYSRNQYHSNKGKTWRRKNREHKRCWGRGYYAKRREHFRANKRKEYRLKIKGNPRRMKERNIKSRKSHKKNNEFYWKQILRGYGGKCKCCGESDARFLSIDHVNNDGAKDRERGIRGINLRRKIVKEGFPDKYQLLCFNCNFAKGIYGVCPHKLKSKKRR